MAHDHPRPPADAGDARGVSLDFELLVEQSLAGVYVLQDDRIVYANPRMAEIFGCSVAELTALSSPLDLVAPEDRERVREMIRRRLSGEIDTVRYTWRGRRRDGELIELESLARRADRGGRAAITGTLVDITELRRQSRDLAEHATRLRNLIEHTQDVVVSADLSGRILSLNPAGERLAGFEPGAAVGRSVLELLPSDLAKAGTEMIGRIEQAIPEGTYEIPVLTCDGQTITVELSVHAIRRDGRPMEFVGIGRDVTVRKQKEEQLRSLALVDDLTGLYNRRGFLMLAERHLKLAHRKKRDVFLLFCDVDSLKRVNDTYGHLEGDRALTDAADVLRRTYRSADIIARLGGDEFTVFPLEADDGSGEVLVQRLAQQLDAHNEASGRPYRLEMSVGLARFDPGSSVSIERLLDEADQRLYQQKRRLFR